MRLDGVIHPNQQPKTHNQTTSKGIIIMNIARHHVEWLSLIEISGPFLSMPVLLRVFPQGLDAHDPEVSRLLRAAYDEWADNQAGPRPDPAIHTQWLRFILANVLEMPREVLAQGPALPPALSA